MDQIGWLMLAIGAFMVALGIVPMIRRVSGVPRLDGIGAFVIGVGILVHALSGLPALSEERWLPWLGTGFIVAAGVLAWRHGQQMGVAHRQPPAGPPK